MRKRFDVCVALSVVLLSIINYLPFNPQRWNFQEALGLFGAAGVIFYIVYKKFSLVVGLNVLWVLIVGIYYFKFPKFYFGIFADLAQAYYPMIVADALLWVFAAVLLGMFLQSRTDVLLRSMEWVLWINVAVMIGQRIFGQELPRYLGAMDNEAMDGTYLLVLYCLSIVRLNRSIVWHLLFGAFIFLTESTTAIVGLLLIWSIMMLMATISSWWIKVLFGLIPLGGILGGISWWYGFDHFWHANGRFVIWKKTFEFWFQDDWMHKFIGLGPGSFEIYGPGIQLQNTVPGGLSMVFIWAHNEYLQVLFELGFIGLFLFGILHIELIVRSFKSQLYWLFLSVIAFAFVEFTQMPWRHAPTSFLAILILCLVYQRTNERTC